MLSIMSRQFADRVLFFGGTALGRTHLTQGRLSEDLDLIALVDRSSLAADLTGVLGHAAPREFGILVWDPPLDLRSDGRPGIIRSADGVSVRIQLLNGEGYPAWPTENRVLHERYRGVAPATLTVPTLAAFVAWKTMAWHDRRAARDLWDLNGLAEAGAIDEAAVQLFVRHGPTGKAPSAWMFESAPSPEQWRSQLAGQTRLDVGPAEALERVRAAWNRAVRRVGRM
jgi:predicted nucleotidyltransferase component of viral defense system